MIPEDVLQRARALVERYDVCNACLGRVFLSMEGKGNEERGRKIREALGKEEPPHCYFCMDWSKKVDVLAEWVVRELRKYEARTFRVGTRLSRELIRREEELFDFVGVDQAESLKRHINREVGKRVKEITGKEFDPRADVEIVIDLEEERAEAHPQPLFLYGRYRKRAEMPQTKWPCRYCGGRGCERCEYTGRQWRETVEYYMADVLLALTMGRETKLHAAGREDIDAFMLGNGRPFVIEIVGPRRRYLDWEWVRKEINAHAGGKIEVICLLPSSREEMRELKSARYPKVYRAEVECEGEVNWERIRELEGKTVVQRTPSRILHRKGEWTRKRRVIRIWHEEREGRHYVYVEAESGLYIKELVSGDGGRTRPSVSDVLGVPCRVTHLDVVEVKGGREC